MLRDKFSLDMKDLSMMLLNVSHSKTTDQPAIDIQVKIKFDVLTQDIEIFPEKSDDRFLISIHSSVHLKNTSEIIRFGRVVKVHEFTESPEFEFHDRLESHDNDNSSEMEKSPEKSKFHVPDQSKFHVEIDDNERFIVGSIPSISLTCQLVSLSVWS